MPYFLQIIDKLHVYQIPILEIYLDNTNARHLNRDKEFE